MQDTVQDTKQLIDDKLSEFGVSFAVSLVGETKRDEWQCDEWRVRLGKFETQYFTGLGHRKKARQAAFNRNFGPIVERPVAPRASDVLYSLLFESEAINESFSDWCANYGYSNDSLSALDTYRACCKIGEELRKIFTGAQRDELRELLQDY